MRKVRKLVEIVVVMAITLVLTMNCSRKPQKSNEQKVKTSDLSDIKKRGKLIAVTDYNSTNYFVYRWQSYQATVLRFRNTL